MKQRLKEMEDEATVFKQMQEKINSEATASLGRSTDGLDEKAQVDLRSAYVGNLDPTTTPEDLQRHFQSCGVINRITILCDKILGTPKGFAYIEFTEQDHVQNAIAMNESLLKGRPLRVTAKRTNLPTFMRFRGRGFSRGRGPARGRGTSGPFRGGRGQQRGAHSAMYAPY